MHREALEREHACHVVNVLGGMNGGGNTGAGDTSERCCDWCNELLVPALQTRDTVGREIFVVENFAVW